MKPIIYILTLVLGISSCKSVDKLVQKGKYEEAFYYSLSHFEGSKKRKTKDVRALERAFTILNEKDLADIEWSRADIRPENYGKIVLIYEKMMRRQHALKTILPIMSEDGYEAKFSLKNYNADLEGASIGAANYHYGNGVEMLNRSKFNNDKNEAKKAFQEFSISEKYVFNFKDVKSLKESAKRLGHKFIYFDIDNRISGSAGIETDRLLWNFAVGALNDEWHTYSFLENEEPENADMIVILDLNYISIGPEKENNHHFTEQKEILVKTDRWFEKRDSIEVEVVKHYHEIVSAKVLETLREKNAVLEGGIRILDTKKDAVISEKPIQVHFNFFDRGMVFHGDSRALTEDTKRRLDPNLDKFPYDDEIIEFLVSHFKNNISKEVSRYKS